MCIFLVSVTDGVYETVVAVLLSIQHAILDEDGDGPQDERHKQVHVNEVPGAVELPGERRERERDKIYHILSCFHSSSQQIHYRSWICFHPVSLARHA